MRKLLTISLALSAAVVCLPAVAQNAPEAEIKVGQTMPYTGPVTAYSTLGKGEIAYFKMLNDQSCVNTPWRSCRRSSRPAMTSRARTS